MNKKRVTQVVAAFLFSICTTAQATPFGELKIKLIADGPGNVASCYSMSDWKEPSKLQALFRYQDGLVTAYVFDAQPRTFYSVTGRLPLRNNLVLSTQYFNRLNREDVREKLIAFLEAPQREKKAFDSGEALFRSLKPQLRQDGHDEGTIKMLLDPVYDFASAGEKAERRAEEREDLDMRGLSLADLEEAAAAAESDDGQGSSVFDQDDGDVDTDGTDTEGADTDGTDAEDADAEDARR